MHAYTKYSSYPKRHKRKYKNLPFYLSPKLLFLPLQIFNASAHRFLYRLFVYGAWYHTFSWTFTLEMFRYQLTVKNCCMLFWCIVYYNALSLLSKGVLVVSNLLLFFSWEIMFQDVINTLSSSSFIQLYLSGKVPMVALQSQCFPSYSTESLSWALFPDREQCWGKTETTTFLFVSLGLPKGHRLVKRA